MPSRYEQILEANSADTPRRWQCFARRGAPIYSDEAAWGALARGYKTAADIVARECCDSNRCRDTIFPPICFLYRHWVELALKSVWKQYFSGGLLDCEPPDNQHRLLILWRAIREASTAFGLFSAKDEFILRVEKSIDLLNSIDPRSTHSRYPTVGDKYHSLGIDIEDLISAVDDIDTFFFGLGVMIEDRGFMPGM
jgi:hypothetical protein